MALSLFCSLVSFFVYYDFFFLFWSIPFIFLFVFYNYGLFSDGLFFSDYLTLFLVFVTVWVFILSILSMNLSPYGFLVLWLMFFLLFFSFLTSNYLIFYFSFELVFVLMFCFLLG